MTKIILPITAYLTVCLIAVLLPASQGYNTFGWKLFVGQIYAVPVLLIAALISFYFGRMKKI
jgi:hypothetical protein